MEIWMEQLMAFLQKHWQFTIIGCGLLIFIGALLNWRWVYEFDHRRVRRLPLIRWCMIFSAIRGTVF